jgi:hypothetical protein
VEIYAAQRAVITFREEATISGGKMCEYPPSAFVRSAPASPRRARNPLGIALAFAIGMGFSAGLGFSVGHAVQPDRAIAQPVAARPAPILKPALPAASSVQPVKRVAAHKKRVAVHKKRVRHVKVHRPVTAARNHIQHVTAHRPVAAARQHVRAERPRHGGIGALRRHLRKTIQVRVLKQLGARFGR